LFVFLQSFNELFSCAYAFFAKADAKVRTFSSHPNFSYTFFSLSFEEILKTLILSALPHALFFTFFPSYPKKRLDNAVLSEKCFQRWRRAGGGLQWKRLFAEDESLD